MTSLFLQPVMTIKAQKNRWGMHFAMYHKMKNVGRIKKHAADAFKGANAGLTASSSFIFTFTPRFG
jgi:hypothetical protein